LIRFKKSMPDIIHLLPETVANQIAAGEVIQRPASAVKELMENAVDAGSTSVKLIIKDAGRTLIQVMDNGCGMSETDALLSFERHATSKIRKAEDLFAIRTMGFRGEALASIASVAQVELKTKRMEDPLGVCIEIEGSVLKSKEACNFNPGTSFSIKNLFFNIPARRNFLKSNTIETRHIIEEFHRIALAHPHIDFTMHHNGMEIFHLNKGNLRQRITGLLGSQYNERLIPVAEDTSILKINGFVSKPEFAKKSRGEQYLFVNNRFIKDAYLNHAIVQAFEQMLPSGSYPSYFLFIDMDTAKIDVNIHPTKTEIKFEDERAIYAIVCSAVKRSLGQYSISPTLDFDRESTFDLPTSYKNTVPVAPSISINPDYNPFAPKEKSPYGNSFQDKQPGMLRASKYDWEPLYPDRNTPQLPVSLPDEEVQQTLIEGAWEKEDEKLTYQLHNRYILSHIKSGIMLIDQQQAHERILYERFMHSLTQNQGASQQQLFPQTIQFSPTDFELVKELAPDIIALGFDLHEFGKNTFVIHGVPTDIPEGNANEILEGIVEQYKQHSGEIKIDKRENLARSMARQLGIKAGKTLKVKEMNVLIDELFACSMPYSSPRGKPTLWIMTLEELAKKFEK
jgi:DNA mismatch repair protein MutL